MRLETFAFFVKTHIPCLFALAEKFSGFVLYFLHRGRIKEVLAEATRTGHIENGESCIRPLTKEDLESFHAFLSALPQDYLAHFKPHGFQLSELRATLRRRNYLLYGVFCQDGLVAYGLLKLYPGQKAFLGFLVAPDHVGMGLGRFLLSYLKWQSDLLGYRLRSSISPDNIASIKSHQSVGACRVVAKLANGYDLYEFSEPRGIAELPVLDIQRNAQT